MGTPPVLEREVDQFPQLPEHGKHSRRFSLVRGPKIERIETSAVGRNQCQTNAEPMRNQRGRSLLGVRHSYQALDDGAPRVALLGEANAWRSRARNTSGRESGVVTPDFGQIAERIRPYRIDRNQAPIKGSIKAEVDKTSSLEVRRRTFRTMSFLFSP